MTKADQTRDLKDDLGGLLALVDKIYGIDRVLSETGRDVIKDYYAQSGPAYEIMHSAAGCMHLAVNHEGHYTPEGFEYQPRTIVAEMKAIGGKRVMELGCGKGFNSLTVAKLLPEAECLGTDLLEPHLVKARSFAADEGVTNLRYAQASYEPVPDQFRDMDVIFGIETLCYAQDLDKVARSVAAALRPGGRFVLFDPIATRDPKDLSPDMSAAVRLYENSTAVTRGFIAAGAWEAALERAGLSADPAQDLSQAVQPGLLRLQAAGLQVLGDWKKQIVVKAMPKYLARNGIAALLGPLVYQLPNGNRDAGLVYQKISATKRAA